jgi:hypothetical protein
LRAELSVGTAALNLYSGYRKLFIVESAWTGLRPTDRIFVPQKKYFMHAD